MVYKPVLVMHYLMAVQMVTGFMQLDHFKHGMVVFHLMLDLQMLLNYMFGFSSSK